MAPVAAALDERRDDLEVVRVFAGQHRELAEELFDPLDMVPDLRLDVMVPDQTLEGVGARLLTEFGNLLATEERPDCVLVQGDTATVFFASLAAFFHRIPVGHVEAGLRSFDRYAPFPEEMMRRLTDRVAQLFFAPTSRSVENLRAEGIASENIFLTGNTVVDAVRHAAGEADRLVRRGTREWADQQGRFVLVTLHRRESFGEDMRHILEGIQQFLDRNPEVGLIFPVHPNPNVRAMVHEMLGSRQNARLTEPLPYFDLVYLLQRCNTVLTDSGGIQEEAPALGKHVLVARKVTERPEGVEAGAATLVGADTGLILSALEEACAAGRQPSVSISKHDTPYGDGLAGRRISDIVSHRLLGRPRDTADWIA
jgi:UDP-N-acetylglucosamine 2-epimerase (non-hydrolysing)